MPKSERRHVHPALGACLLVGSIVAMTFICIATFAGAFRQYVPVTLAADRAGLVMESGAKVKMRGVEVGRVAQIDGDRDHVKLTMQLDPDMYRSIPANVTARIEATTAFGAKYVDLIPPSSPSAQHIRAGAVVHSSNVSTEVNTVFQNLVSVLQQVQPENLNATLAALAEGFRGKGSRINQAIGDADEVLRTVNPRMDTLAADFRSVKGFSATYAAAAPDILSALEAFSTTSQTIVDHAGQLDALLLNVTGLANDGTALLAPNAGNLNASVNNLAPTTDLLLKYDPEYTCTLVGAYNAVPYSLASGGGNGRSAVLDAAILFGDDVYRYPENLPKVNARGGPGGKPGCGSLPDVVQNFPVKALVTDTGWGTNPNEIRTNPGIGHPWWVNFFPQTRAVPEAPSFRGEDSPRAPGPWPPALSPPPPATPGVTQSPALPPPPTLGPPSPGQSGPN